MQELILLHIEMWQDNVSLSREKKKLDYIGIKSDHLATMVVFLSKFKENKIPSSERLNGLYKTGIFHTAFSARLSCPHSLCFSLSLSPSGESAIWQSIPLLPCALQPTLHLHSPPTAHTLMHTGRRVE